MSTRLATASALLALCLACDRPDPIVCGGPTVACTTGCVVLATDGANCGACGHACSEGQVCSQGECAPVCATPLTTCGEGDATFCADTRSDPAHCGSCDIACPEGQGCAGGVCATGCAAPLTTCGEGATASCVDTRSDPANCGGCGNRCAGGQACLGGQCTITCAAPLATCGEGLAAFCADTRSDPAHCGSCATACGPGQVCAGGSCASTCEGTGSSLCVGRCVDLLTDGAHCGDCATACAPSTTCTAGRCKPTCPAEQTRCGDLCVSLTTDAANCGACGNACPATAVCNRGTCEAPVCTAGFGLPGQPNFLGERSFVVAAGDLNGDRLPDLVYAKVDDDGVGTEIDVLLNQGGRSFAAPKAYPVGMQVTSVLVGDVDGDGVRDVVAVGDANGQSQAALLRGVGDGTLRTPLTTPVAGARRNNAALGDLTGDGRADLVLGAGKVTVYPGTRAGFGAPTSYSSASFSTSMVALGDVNGDGRLDVITGGNDNLGHVDAYLNMGGGALVAAARDPTSRLAGSIVELAAGDLDGDGLADAVVVQEWSASAPASQLQVLRSDGAGGYRPADSYPISWYPYGLALGDLDSDGRLDVAVGDWSDTRRVALLHNTGGGILSPAGGRFEEGVKAMVFADLDGDLRPDLAVASGPGFGIHLLWNRAGALEEPALQAAPATDGVRSPSEVAVADLDGDGHRDAVAVDYQRGEVLVFRGAGDDSLALQQVIPVPGAALVRVGDLDGDGRPDLLVGANHAQVFLARDGGFVAGLELPSPAPLTYAGAELLDLDEDGLLDLLSIAAGGGISYWRGRGDGTFDPPLAVGGAADLVRAADVDGNGWPDLVSIGAGKVRVALGLGGGRFAPPIESPLGSPLGTSYYPLEAALGDLDGDGRIDLAVSDGSYHGALGVLLGRGDGSFGAVQVRQDLHGPTGLRVARLGNGRSAIAVRGAIAMTIAIYEVDTHGVLQPPRRWTGLGADGLDLGDLDGDLRPDVVTGALGGLAVLPVRCLR